MTTGLRPEARTLEAVLFPHRFACFPGVVGADACAAAWSERPDWVLANLAHAAYLDAAWLDVELPRLGASTVATFERDGAFAFLARWPDIAVLSFRGTEAHKPLPIPAELSATLGRVLGSTLGRQVELPAEYLNLLASDVLADLRFRQRPLGVAQVHRGFLGELRKLWRPLLPALRPLAADPGLRLVATGHSLGGALATLTAVRLRLDEVVTFGEPRVGSGLDSAFLGEAGSHRRYVNGWDPVPRLPPDTWPFDYQHHGVEQVLQHPEGRDPRYDHSILSYVDLLAGQAT